MFPDQLRKVPEPLFNRSLLGFINTIEADLRIRNKYPDELARYSRYFEALGGQLLTISSISKGIKAIAKTFSPLNKMALIQPVDAKRPTKTSMLKQFQLTDILALQPKFPDFWRNIAENDIVTHSITTQSSFEKLDRDIIISIGEGADISFPNCVVDVRDDSTVRIYFIEPTGLAVLYPDSIANDTFVFSVVPKVIDRAFRVYFNACQTRKKPLFWDADASHMRYKLGNRKRLAIEYKIDRPNRMRPVMVDI